MSKSVEVRINEALEQLKAKVSSAKYKEVCESIDGFQKYPTIKEKLTVLEAAVAATKLAESDNSFGGHVAQFQQTFTEAKQELGFLFGVEKKATTIKETAAPVKKHNGAAENFVEGSPLNEGRVAAASSNNSTVSDARAKSDQILHEALGFTAEQQSILAAGKPTAYANLTEQKKKDYDFARLIGLNESDALKVATIQPSNNFPA